ncbi:MAG TPA: TrbI/VirB10 family protein [Victivallales bacterium]|nr:TrbI/VirB10 family protein [Victivallales bacterium]
MSIILLLVIAIPIIVSITYYQNEETVPNKVNSGISESRTNIKEWDPLHNKYDDNNGTKRKNYQDSSNSSKYSNTSANNKRNYKQLKKQQKLAEQQQQYIKLLNKNTPKAELSKAVAEYRKRFYSNPANKQKSKVASPQVSEYALSSNNNSLDKVYSEADLYSPYAGNNKTKNKFEQFNIYNGKTEQKKLYESYLPHSTLIPCQLITTIQTSNGSSPILAVVTKNVYNDGKLIIRANTLASGFSKGMPLRDHVMTENNWVLIFRTTDQNNGKELKVKAIALENGTYVEGKHFDLLDGSIGIKGYVTDRRDMDELKELAAGLTSDLAGGLTNAAAITAGAMVGDPTGASSSLSSLGQSIGSSATNASQQSAKIVAEKSLINDLENKYYITCPAGTKFYLMLQSTLDFDDASIAATKDNS